jgi:translocation and assembly module TamA
MPTLWLFNYANASSTPKKISTSELNVSIKINGVSKEISEEIDKNISINRYKNYAKKSISNLKFLFEKAPSEIKNTLIPFGYYNPTLSINMLQDLNDWNITYDIHLGKPMIIKDVTIKIYGEASTDKKFKILEKEIPLEKGDILTQTTYEDTKTQLLNLAFERGYFNAKLASHIIKINKENNTALISLTLKTGKRYKIGAVTIKQKQYDFNTKFIKSFLQFQSKDYYDSSNIIRSQTDLQRSPYFSSVTITPETNKENLKNNDVPVTVDLIAKKPVTYTLGGGWGSYTGPRILGGLILRHLTQSGHYAEFNIEASKVNTTFLGQYIIPGNKPATDYWSINAQQSTIQTIPYNSQESSAGVNQTIRRGNFTNNFGIHATYIKYNTEANANNQYKHYIIPSWQVMYKYTSPHGYWNRGFQINNSLMMASQTAGSSNSFIKNTTIFEYSLPIMSHWNRLIFKNNFGVIITPDLNLLAAPLRFYAGGIGSLLGYQYLSQGPTNSQGDLIGGKYLLTSALAFEQRVYGDLSILNYINAGNATNTLNLSEANIKYAAGIGLAYKSPLGPLQFFFTRSLNPGDRHWRFDFSLGMFLS